MSYTLGICGGDPCNPCIDVCPGGTSYPWVASGIDDVGPTGWIAALSRDFVNPYSRAATCTISGGDNSTDDDFYVGAPMNSYAFGGDDHEFGPHEAFSFSFAVSAGATVHLDLWNGGPVNAIGDLYGINIVVCFQ